MRNIRWKSIRQRQKTVFLCQTNHMSWKYLWQRVTLQQKLMIRRQENEKFHKEKEREPVGN